MRCRIIWTMVSFVTAVSLLLVSCGPKAVPTPAPVTPAPAPTAPSPAAPTPIPVPSIPTQSALQPAEKPKYGGTLNSIYRTETAVFDNNAIPQALTGAAEYVHEQLVIFDWSQGLAGSGKIDYGLNIWYMENYGPQLAESWETPEIGTWVLKIRRGVRWGLNPASEASRLVNGREFTADDVVWNINRQTKTATATTVRSNPAMSKALTVEKTGPWEVTVKAPVEPLTAFWWVIYGGNAQHMFASEVTQKYGNETDWRNSVGTGVGFITDYVPGSVTTVTRNQNYWDKNPAGPGKGDQLPYWNTVKLFIIPDVSTRLAVMRTGKGDVVSDIEAEDARSLIKTNPDIQYKKYNPGGVGIVMRLDKSDLPFKNKRVRQALMMAIDYQAISNDLYNGEAETLIFPIGPAWKLLHVPMNELPEATQQLYRYNGERAKQFLAEAGYPKGFKTKMIVENISARMDPASVIKAMWAKVGVDVELQPRDTAVFSSIPSGEQEELKFATVGSTNLLSVYTLSEIKSPTVSGRVSSTTINDPSIDQVYYEMQKHIIVNMKKASELYRQMVPYLHEQAFVIPVPRPYLYTLWQPWVKNFYGDMTARPKLFGRFFWIDQDLKEKMTGRR